MVNFLSTLGEKIIETAGEFQERIGATGETFGERIKKPIKRGLEASITGLAPVKIIANIEGGMAIRDAISKGFSDPQKSVQIATERNQIRQSYIKRGVSPDLALKYSRNELTPTQVNDIWGLTIGFAVPSGGKVPRKVPGLKEPIIPPKPLKAIPSKKVAPVEGRLETLQERIARSPIKVNPPQVRGGITPPELDFSNWKDKSALSLSRETLERNLPRVAGKDAPKLKEFIVDPVRRNETLRIKFLNDFRKETTDTIVQNLGIKASSKEDVLIQRFGEGNISLETLKTETPKWKQVQEASNFFRQKYDQLLDSVNLTRENFGYNPISKRKDYFRHFQELDGIIRNFGVILREQDLPTEIAGLTEFFRPGKPFSTAELKRLGGPFTESAIRGMDNYLDTISRQIFHIDSVQRARGLEKYIRLSAKEGQVTLPNFVANIKEYGNLLAGKKATFDRAFESLLGRRFYVGMNMLRSRTGANMIGANIGSALTNFIPFTQAAATTSKTSLLRGLLEGVLSPFKKSFSTIDGVSSNFLIRRFPVKYIDPTKFQKAQELAGWLFETIDKFASRSIVAGKYFENINRGLSPKEAMKLADEYAGRIITDRSLGQLPNLLNVRSLGFLTQFQTEINNLYSFVVRDIPHLALGSKTKIISSISQFVLYSYLFNSAFEKTTGRRPSLDPLNLVLVLSGAKEDDKGREFTEFIGNLPFTGGITGGRFPIGAGLPNTFQLAAGKTTLGKELIKPVFFLVPPFGGLQLKKTLEGLIAFERGQVRSKSGKTKLFRIEATTPNLLRTTLFGKYSTPEAKEFFRKKIKGR